MTALEVRQPLLRESTAPERGRGTPICSYIAKWELGKIALRSLEGFPKRERMRLEATDNPEQFVKSLKAGQRVPARLGSVLRQAPPGRAAKPGQTRRAPKSAEEVKTQA